MHKNHKCMIVLPSSRRTLAPLLSECAFKIGGMRMEIVSSYCHLGHIICNSLSDEQDILRRRSAFVGHVNSVLCYFGKLPSAVKARLFHSYCTSFYGCVLSDLSCGAVDSFYSAAALHAMQSAVIPTAIPSVCPFVRPSVTRWYPIQTNEHRITRSSL